MQDSKNISSTPNVLIVEDDADISAAMTELFEGDGFKVYKAFDGEEGLKSAIANHPRIILLDVMMPKMDGITMLRLLRDDTWGKDALVIILTNSEDSAVISDAMHYEAINFFVKANWDLGNVLKEVKRILKLPPKE